MAGINKLTHTFVEKAKPGRHADGAGLYLLVKPSGSKSWVLRIQHERKRQDFGLGSANKIGLSAVRDTATRYRQWIAQGKSPKVELAKLKENPVPAFRTAAIARHGQIKDTFRNPKHAAQWLSTLQTYAFPSLGDMLVSDIEIEHVADALRPIWFDKPETAARVKQRIADVMDMAHLQRQRTTELPVRKIGKLLGSQTQARKAKNYGHHPSLAYEDLPECFSRLRAGEITMGRLSLMFQILTAGRSGEVRFARWSEIDGAKWVIPAERMKGDMEHIVYLSDAALEILEIVKTLKIGSLDNLIFVGQKSSPLSDATMAKVLRTHSKGLRVDDGKDSERRATVHGNRATFRTWVQEQCPTVPEPVAELSLAHKQTDAVIAAYSRGKFEIMRRELMANWAIFATSRCDNIVRLVV
ncbi:integrase arm-type DNA-binding domain-containing protein [Parasphingorhabdus sp.]